MEQNSKPRTKLKFLRIADFFIYLKDRFLSLYFCEIIFLMVTTLEMNPCKYVLQVYIKYNVSWEY